MRINKVIAAIYVLVCYPCGQASSETFDPKTDCQIFHSLRSDGLSHDIDRLLSEMPEKSTVIVCERTSGIDLVYLLSPVYSRDGVTFFSQAIFEMAESDSPNKMRFIELLSKKPLTENTMMARGKGPFVAQFSQKLVKSFDFIETSKLSVGSFRLVTDRISNLPSSTLKLRKIFDLRRLDEESLQSFEEFSRLLSDGRTPKLRTISYRDVLFEGTPSLTAEIAIQDRKWGFEFDFGEKDRIVLLAFSEVVF